ncbi:MAG: amino acid ABC transporter permease [Pseudomonadota bacterium]
MTMDADNTMRPQTLGPRGMEDDGHVAFFNDPKVRSILFQTLLIIGLVAFVLFIVTNTAQNLNNQSKDFGWSWLDEPAGFGINQTLVPYQETSAYSQVFWVGLTNTLLVAILGIFIATVVGFVVGIARLSTNWVVAKLAYGFVEIFRNVPLLLWLFIFYFGIVNANLPSYRDVFAGLAEGGAQNGDSVFALLSKKGLALPKPIFLDGSMSIFIAFLVGIVAAYILGRWAKNRQVSTGQTFPSFWTGVGLIIGLPLLAYLIMGRPVEFELPTLSRFNLRGGMNLIPEMIALLFALSLYTSAYIAEIVRAGILAVSKGQSEASSALGLQRGQALRLVIVPQALRVIVPPLTNQFLNLTKNSSLAVAIAYPELVSVFFGTALNQVGREVEIVLITMGTYLILSLITSTFMNWYNSRISLVER